MQLIFFLAFFYLTCVHSQSFISDLVNENIFPGREDGRIVGGKEIGIEKRPYMASIQLFFEGKWEHFCGGSLITLKHVLSASHCYYSL